MRQSWKFSEQLNMSKASYVVPVDETAKTTEKAAGTMEQEYQQTEK